MEQLENKLNQKFENLNNTDFNEKRKELELLVMNQLSATGTVLCAFMPGIGILGEGLLGAYNYFTGRNLEKKIFKEYEQEFNIYKENKDYKNIKKNMDKYFTYSNNFSKGFLFGMALALAAYVARVPFGDEVKELCNNLIQYSIASGVLNGTVAISYHPKYHSEENNKE
ncbi:MAG: hypothetical protein QW210_04505 [Candidatus Woesearchaeota archaeon]